MGVCGSVSSPRGKTMLIVDREVDPNGDLVRAVLSDVVVVKYDSTKDTADELLRDVARTARQSGAEFQIIGFANHSGDVWQIAKDRRPEVGVPCYLDAVRPIINLFVRILVKNGGRIDLLGCRLLEKDHQLCDKLEKRYPNVNFTASDDKTGNLASGGDWLMESDGDLDVKKDYFDPEKLKKYTETMNWSLMDAADCIPVVGAVARTAEAGVCLASGDTEGAKEAAMNATLNAAGDALGAVTGGGGKVAMAGVRAAGKVAMKAGAKAALKAAAKAISKKMTKEWWKSYAKKYIKKKIKKEYRKQVKQAWKRFEDDGELPDELTPMVDILSNATGMTPKEVYDMDQNDFLMCLASIADLPDCDPNMEGWDEVVVE